MIPFINKDTEFIDLPIPSYFQNTESPIICYKNNLKLLPLNLEIVKILNFVINQCGNLKIITDSRICSIISKGPRYRPPPTLTLKCRKTIAGALSTYLRAGVKENMLSLIL